MSYRFELHLGWLATYYLIGLLFVLAEFYALGAGSQYSLTRNTFALVERVPWLALIFVPFLIWLPIHFVPFMVRVLLKWFGWG